MRCALACLPLLILRENKVSSEMKETNSEEMNLLVMQWAMMAMENKIFEALAESEADNRCDNFSETAVN